MDMITVKVSDLWEKVRQMKNDGMDKVTITLFEPEDDFPASMGFVAVKKPDITDYEASAEWDYEDIDAV